MKKKHLSKLVMFMALGLPLVSLATAQQPTAPDDLKVEVVGHRVSLNWANPDEGEKLLFNGFENDTVDQSERIPIDVDGWTVKTTNTSDYSCTWFNYPTPDYMGASDYKMLIHSGERSAAVFFDPMEGGHDMHQDEWLISPILEKAAYLEFSCYVDPRIVANSAEPDYPDHYVVIVSTDGGGTWSVPVWEVGQNASPEGGWQTVTLALAQNPTDSMRVAFRAYGDYQFDENGDTINQSLYGVWAIDDIKITAARPNAPVQLVAADFETAEAEGEEGDMDTTFNALEGWTVKKTALEAELGEEDEPEDFTAGWFRSPVMEDDEVFPMMVTAGARSAMVMPAYVQYQDEWLISPVVKVKAGQTLSLQFAYTTSVAAFGDNEATEDVEEEDFWSMTEGAGYYEVLVSKDGGKNWMEEPVWTMANDDKGEMTEYGMYTNTVQVAIEVEPTDEVKIAFRARAEVIKDEETDEVVNQILGGFWAIDDVIIRSVDAASVIDHYKIQIDGKDLANNVRGTSYVDKSEKTAGKHAYAVYAVSGSGQLSPAASVEVDLCEIVFAAPENFVCTPVLDEETGRYTVTMTWEPAKSEFPPVYYNVYNGKLLFGMEMTAEAGQAGLGITNCLGVYEFSVEAVYQTPDGVSERVVRRLALGVRFGVTDLKAEAAGHDVQLSWTAPQEDGYPMGTYTVYRGDEKIAEGLKETSYKDEAVKDGYYQYTVIAVYEDKVESVRASVSCQVGDPVRVTLPYFQYFNTTFLPADWRIENQSTRTPDRYIWYFDDKSRLGIKGEGFDGCYAAIDCIDAPGYTRDATLELPAIDLSTVQDKSTITLSFNYSYAIKSGASNTVGTEWSVDGEEWNIFELIDKENGFDPDRVGEGEFHIQRANQCIGDYDAILETIESARTLYLRFHYSGTKSQYFALDNVVVAADKDVDVEKVFVEGDWNVRVSAQGGLMQVRSTQPITRIELYTLNGTELMDRKGNNELMMTLPVDYRGLALVRVTTAQGVKTVKMLL